MEKELLTPHQRAEQALRDIDKLCKPYALTDAEFADAKKDPNIHQSIEIVAAAIEAGSKPAVSVTSRERAEELSAKILSSIYGVGVSSDEQVTKWIAEAVESAVQQEREACAKLLEDISPAYWPLAKLIRARHTAPPVSADNKETNV